MSDWGNPIRKKQPKAQKPPKVVIEKELPLFKKEALKITRAEAKKVLGVSGLMSHNDTAWVERWLSQKIAERSYPPQLCGPDAYGLICAFLNQDDSLRLLDEIRADYARQKPSDAPPLNPFGFLEGLPEVSQPFL